VGRRADDRRQSEAPLDRKQPHRSRLRNAGFATALDVARARRDEKTIEDLKEIIEDILQKFRAARTDAPVVLRIEPYARLNFAGLIRYVEAFSFRHLPSIEHYERTLSLLTDHRRLASADITHRIAAFAAEFNYTLLEAQARRALGVMAKNREELERAVTLFRGTGAVPYEARARCEHAIVVGDESEFVDAERVLEQLGDIDQLERLTVARKKTS